MVNKLANGCTFGLVLEQKVKGISDNMAEGFCDIKKDLKNIKDKNEQMFNHMSDRPSKSMVRQQNILIAICSLLSGAVLTLISILIYGARVS